jgi:hypothetical protein
VLKRGLQTMEESQKTAITTPSFKNWPCWLLKNPPPQSAMADIWQHCKITRGSKIT